MKPQITGVFYNAITGRVFSLERLPSSRNVWVVHFDGQTCYSAEVIQFLFFSRYARTFVFRIGDL